MVTGSHNPGGENGFKIILGKHRVHGAALRELVATEVRLLARGVLAERPGAPIGLARARGNRVAAPGICDTDST